jgi:transposase
VDFSFALNKAKLRLTRRREGRYLLRSNMSDTDPAKLWEFYLQLSEVEAACKQLKGDLAVRPIYHQRENRVEAHIFVAFIAYCIQVTLKHRLRLKAPGLTARQALDKFSTRRDARCAFPNHRRPRTLIFTRYTEPEPDQHLLLAQLDWILPQQPPPRITAKIAAQM